MFWSVSRRSCLAYETKLIDTSVFVFTTAKSGKLQLDKAIVLREVVFYGLSIALLLFALRDNEPVDDDELGEDHIFISFGDSCMVFGAYVSYVWVMANFDLVKKLFTCRSKGFAAAKSYGSVDPSDRSKVRARNLVNECKGEVQSSTTDYIADLLWSQRTSFHLPDMPFMAERPFASEPKDNFQEAATYYRTTSGLEYNGVEDEGEGEIQKTEDRFNRKSSFLAKSVRNVAGNLGGKFSDGASIRLFHFEVNIEKPSDQHELHEILINQVHTLFNICFGATICNTTHAFLFLLLSVQ